MAQGTQQALDSPVSITRIAVGDPSIADVQANGDSAFLLTGVAPGTTSLMVWTACSKSPRQSMVFVKGKASTGFTTASLAPSEDPTLPSQVQTDIRFVEVSRTKLQEASTSIFGMGSNFLLGSPGALITTAENIITGGPPANNKYFNIGFGGGRVRAMNSGNTALPMPAMRRAASTGADRPGRTRISCANVNGRRRSR